MESWPNTSTSQWPIEYMTAHSMNEWNIPLKSARTMKITHWSPTSVSVENSFPFCVTWGFEIKSHRK
jgi:hypothetical protein